MSDLSLSIPKKELAHGSKDTFPSTKHQFKKGQSGNPAGRPMGVTKAYTAKLKEIDPKTGKTNAELIAEAIMMQAKDGKNKWAVSAAQEIRRATEEKDDEGKSVGNLNLTVIQIMRDMGAGKVVEGMDVTQQLP